MSVVKRFFVSVLAAVVLLSSLIALGIGLATPSSAQGPLVQVITGDGLDNPIPILSDGTHVWVGNNTGCTITELDASTGAFDQLDTAEGKGLPGPTAMSYDGTYLWVVGGDAISAFDPSTGALVENDFWQVPGEQENAGLDDPEGVSSDGTNVWVANFLGNSVTEMNASTGAIVQVLNDPSYGFSGPEGIYSNGTYVWVVNTTGNSVTELNASTGALVQVLDASDYEFDYPRQIAYDGTNLWITNRDGNSVTELNASTGDLVQVISGSTYEFNFPNSISFDGTDVWVASQTAITELDASTGDLVQVISGSTYGFNDLIDGVSSDGVHVWVTSGEGESVTELNAAPEVSMSTSASPASGSTGAPATYSDTATVSGIPAFPDPTGSIIFTLYAANCATVELGPSPAIAISSSGTATFSETWTPNTPGSYYWVTTYTPSPGSPYVITSDDGSCNESNESVTISEGSTLSLQNTMQVQTCGKTGCPSATVFALLLDGAGAPISNQLVSLQVAELASAKSKTPQPVIAQSQKDTDSGGLVAFLITASSPEAVKVQATAVDPLNGVPLTSATALVIFSPPPTSLSPIGALTYSLGGNCTGSVIASSSGSVVATAGHCVTDAEAKGSGVWTFWPGYNFAHSYPPYGSWTVSQVVTDGANYPGNESYDYAFFALDSDDYGRTVQEVAGAFNDDFSAHPGKRFTQYGYPAIASSSAPAGLVTCLPKHGKTGYLSSPDSNGAAQYYLNCRNNQVFIGSSSGGPLVGPNHTLAGVLEGPGSSILFPTFTGVQGAFLTPAALPIFNAANDSV